MDRDEAFTAFVRVHRVRLRDILGTRRVSADQVGRPEQLWKLYVAWFRVVGTHESYVRTIIARTAADEGRRPWRREITGEVEEDLTGKGDDEAADAIVRLTLRTALVSLPLRQRQVVVLRHYWGASVQETAAMLGVSSGSVKSHGSRALKRLNALLALEEVLD